jgi:hypothetical protein
VRVYEVGSLILEGPMEREENRWKDAFRALICIIKYNLRPYRKMK